MAKVLEGLYYSESHEYVRVEGDFVFFTFNFAITSGIAFR